MIDDSGICVTIGDKTQTVLCGLCKTPISSRFDVEPDADLGCAACDNWANYDEITEAVGSYVMDQVHNAIVGNDADAVDKGNGQAVHDKTYRFLVELHFDT